MDICLPEVVAIGHHCTYERHYPKDHKVQKIMDWPDYNTLIKIRVFLGICSIVRIWVKDFAKHVKPLILLMKKDVDFFWVWIRKCSWRI